jgi:hypothetical protein
VIIGVGVVLIRIWQVMRVDRSVESITLAVKLTAGPLLAANVPVMTPSGDRLNCALELTSDQ